VPTPLRDTGTLTAVRVTAKREVHQNVNEEESIFQMVERRPRASMRNVPLCMENSACRGHVSIQRATSAISRIWRFGSEVGILQLAQWQSPLCRYSLFTGVP